MKLKVIFSIMIFFVAQLLLAQTAEQINPIVEKIEKYFELDRENIHLSLNKNIFLTSESIWFKGYVTEKKTGFLFPKTTNAIVYLLDQNGTILQNKLCYTERGVFAGSFDLNSKMKSGKYYLQVFTNFMNNFSEDESSIYNIKIYNQAEQNNNENKNFDVATIKINLAPEGGTFLNGIDNTIAVEITDCNGNGATIENARVLDQKGTELSDFYVNELGFGRFDISMVKFENYKIVFDCKGKKFEKQLPFPTSKGAVLSANNYSFDSKTYLTIKTNQTSLPDIAQKKGEIIVLSNGQINILDFVFSNDLETKIMVSNELFFKGINTIFLIDENNQRLASKNIFFAPEKKSLELTILEKSGSDILIQGNSNLKSGNLNISVLPVQTVCVGTENSAFSNIFFASNFEKGLKNTKYYFENYDKKKMYELDIELFFKQSKYSWENITANIPIEKYEFDNAISLKGTVNVELQDKEKCSVRMSSVLAGIDIKTYLNSKNEFFFKNIFAQDSTRLHFELYDRNNKKITMRMATQFENINRRYMKPFANTKKECLVDSVTTETINFPTMVGLIALEAIEIKNKAKKLENALKYGNFMARGFKITDDYCRQYRDIYSFLMANGFNVQRHLDHVDITPFGGNSRLGRSSESAAVFINEMQEFDLGSLDMYSFCDIDEIYINKRGMGNTNGSIKIYMRKLSTKPTSVATLQSQSILVKNGFFKIKPFTNPPYFSTVDVGFQQYGTVHWINEVDTDLDGNFKFKIPTTTLKSVKVVIEGIDEDGNIVSETKILKI